VATSDSLLRAAPALSLDSAARLARELFAIDGHATPLPSERDQNFLIVARGEPRAVLKVASGAEDRGILEAQQAALAHLARSVDTTPRVLTAAGGESLVDARGDDGRSHLAWAVSYLPGRPLTLATYRSPRLLEDLGRQIGAIDAALADFDHPAVHRDFYWDLANARRIVGTNRSTLPDPSLGAMIDTLVARFDRHTAPLLERLPRSVIHGDPNDYNILVGGGEDVESRGQSISGVVDLGDMVHSYRVADLSITLAYAMLDARDPLAVAAQVVRGFSERVRLGDDELASAFGLAAMRLCVSACIAASQLGEKPDHEYLGVSQAAIARTLPRLATIPFGLATAVVREAAGMAPSPHAASVVEFLARQPSFPAVLGVDARTEPSIVLDLSVASPMLAGDTSKNDEPSLTRRVDEAMRDAGVRVAIGRYDEPRLLYVAPAFALGPRLTDAHRTIHIGLDLFADAGMPVFAPLDGEVAAFNDNGMNQDYGPVIILRHRTHDGVEFFTLYGHLSRESLDGLSVGKRIKAGERIATLGSADVNGGWTPHLHLQIITDPLDLGADFPGVAASAQRSVWTSICPDPNLIVRVPGERFPRAERHRSAELDARRKTIGGNLSLSYREPVEAVRGWMQYLFDREGRRCVDAYNNVPHVGHCHPRVVEAAERQMRVLNTNTRYLNELLERYAETLLATLPRSLDVCYFVSSASEANELALRLARAFTGRKDTVVLEAAYHGNTTALIDISPYKHAGPGGSGAPDWVHVAPQPDDYRGAYRRGDPDAGAKYASHVAEIVQDLSRRGRGVAAYIAETCPSVGGQIIFPPRYLEKVYESVRAAGGVCIADEVQTGLGRMGTSFWAFEDQHVEPDIVVMGKPLGNGHPIAAVATTRALADAFDNGMEYFSTFGGNTVSCAVGRAVLDVVREENLQAHALHVGNYLLDAIRPLAGRHEIIGDVRGSGLFLGVELVRDRETREPAGDEASFVANRMREKGVLLGTDGPHHNVVKIRPPMPFGVEDAELLVEALDASLGELAS
jgi:4-aminobutyrate aminotransferase-like enzyme/Ser/Thr protein kinase RdoA (MazF antagonist)